MPELKRFASNDGTGENSLFSNRVAQLLRRSHGDVCQEGEENGLHFQVKYGIFCSDYEHCDSAPARHT
ncbi:hypothetical protein F2P81_018365 [Scophthalmus maximus]|uniref:Uncharacterized protein n=1 Tax=Scophthalmus maximus TaxID=52904 RepID=A0A6A4SC06_SCOMX|nr:hypothetical protein F2P81_018365 [Scophthalmus maximus]